MNGGYVLSGQRRLAFGMILASMFVSHDPESDCGDITYPAAICRSIPSLTGNCATGEARLFRSQMSTLCGFYCSLAVVQIPCIAAAWTEVPADTRSSPIAGSLKCCSKALPAQLHVGAWKWSYKSTALHRESCISSRSRRACHLLRIELP